jgi:acetyltransferase
VLLFGMGGQLVEVFKDRALSLPPLTTTLARRMIEQTKIYTALKGVRGRPPVDLTALEGLLVRFSELVLEQRWIKEIDINPLLASPERLVALDARVVVHGQDVKDDALPTPAIRPYPTRYEGMCNLRDGSDVFIRPIRPEDEPLLVKFHEALSDKSVYQLYMHMLTLNQRITHERLTRMCFIDYDREIALVALSKDADSGEHKMVGVTRMKKMHGNGAELGTIVSDDYQAKGLGIELVRRTIEIAKDEKLKSVAGKLLPDNVAMQRVCERLGFKIEPSADGKVVNVQLRLA